MAAIIIRMHESKTPGEDFALEERKDRRRELPCPLTVKLLHAAGSVTNSDWSDYATEMLAIALYFPHPVAVKANTLNDFKESDARGYMGKKGNSIRERRGKKKKKDSRLFSEFSKQFHLGIGLFY